MVLCLFTYFLAVHFDWSIILIRKSLGASRHISGKLGVKLAIGCFSWCKCLYMMSNFEDWENWEFFWFNWEKNILFGFGNDSRKGSLFYIGKITEVVNSFQGDFLILSKVVYFRRYLRAHFRESP